jgi:hypothetical protein
LARNRPAGEQPSPKESTISWQKQKPDSIAARREGDGLGMGLGFKKSAMGNDFSIWIRCKPLKSPDSDE